jgi:ATP-dependent DNA helicase RecQ
MNVPAYIVFDDAALRRMAFHAPQTKDAFLRIKGVGNAKLKQFGDRFISVIRKHMDLDEVGRSSLSPDETPLARRRSHDHQAPTGQTTARGRDLNRTPSRFGENA